jgi:hypothetical protein
METLKKIVRKTDLGYQGDLLLRTVSAYRKQ